MTGTGVCRYRVKGHPAPIRAKEEQMAADLSKISSTEPREAVETLCRISGAGLYGSADDIYEMSRRKEQI